MLTLNINDVKNHLWFLLKKATFTNNDKSDYKRDKNFC